MRQPHDQLNQVAAFLREQVDGRVEPEADQRQAERLVQALADPPVARRPRVWAAAALLLCVVAATIVVVPRLIEEAPLGYALEGPALRQGDYLRTNGAPSRLRFDDGTVIELEPDSSGRLQQLGSHGATLQLERGQASLAVVPLPNASWSVAAGPFTVQVTGTRFTVSWEPATQRLEVKVSEGTVQVQGGSLGAGVELQAGQQLSADGNTGEMHLGARASASATMTASAAPAAAPAGGDVSATPVSTATASAAGSGRPGSDAALVQSWSQRVAQGDYARVLDEADARGLSGVLGSVSLADLVALSDAARYRGRGDVARRALLAMRERFAGSEPARTAAFLLGRMAEGGSAASALNWYDRYLTEAPGGGFAAEALGRKMVVLQQSGSSGAARAVATRYLASYPRGAYAAVARKLVGPATR